MFNAVAAPAARFCWCVPSRGCGTDAGTATGTCSRLTSCRWEQALNLLAGISSRGLSPDVVSFSSAMSACDRAGEWQVINTLRCVRA